MIDPAAENLPKVSVSSDAIIFRIADGSPPAAVHCNSDPKVDWKLSTHLSRRRTVSFRFCGDSLAYIWIRPMC